ncbi:hypothetical protein HDA32_006058 [Spinactinospora alkalitolerans]|uniref:Cyclase n=1 Tax=Spinactinospora alkalitolerans TaxID=687207 RepID=A0A852U3Z1_9ACTN|nr:hypothetical protein [Spinactinospora alkalitolerans]NYE50938.1 hypothetical protein [Spinactinospora alkalitolerans]
MPILQIDHKVSDFDEWKTIFDRDPLNRKERGVRRHRVAHPVDDRNHLVIELEFDSVGEAEAFLAALREDVWRLQETSPALVGEPRTRIVETVESREY